MVRDNTHWIIGHGAKTNSWLEEPLAHKFNIPEILHNPLTFKVRDSLHHNVWNLPDNLKAYFPSLQLLLDNGYSGFRLGL